MNQVGNRHILAIVLFPICLFLLGCQTSQTPQVVRLVSSSDGTEWRYNINGGDINSVGSTQALTELFSRIHLKFGDIAIFNAPPQPIEKTKSPSVQAVVDFCSSNKVAGYVFDWGQSEEIFSIPAFHWISSYSDPRSLKNSRFYLEGKALGKGETGYERMVQVIKKTTESKLFLLGSLYDQSRGFGDFETPFEEHREDLDKMLSARNKKQILLSLMPEL